MLSFWIFKVDPLIRGNNQISPSSDIPSVEHNFIEKTATTEVLNFKIGLDRNIMIDLKCFNLVSKKTFIIYGNNRLNKI